MSNSDSERGGPSRRGFGIILGGLAAGAVLGTTVVAHADDDGHAVRDTALEPSFERKRPAQRQIVDLPAVSSLAAKLDALDLTADERALLAGLLSVATDAIARSSRGRSASPLVSTGSGPGPLIEVRTPASIPSVGDQFRAAFTPGAVPPPENPELEVRPDYPER